MTIAGTNAYCKLTDIKVTENTAIISLLIFATKSTSEAKSFRICVKDKDTNKISYVNNNTYWIDRVNNYNYDSNNIDTNKYKEITLSLDITRSNTSDIQGNRWVRNCYIYLLDSSKRIDERPAWSSELLTLTSDSFEAPEIKNISFETTNIKNNKGKIKTKFNLSYVDGEKFFNNNNFSIFLYIKSIYSDKVLEEKEISTSSISSYNEIETTNSYEINSPVVVQILLANKNKRLLNDYRKIYKPIRKYSDSFVKINGRAKRVLSYYIMSEDK